MPGFPLKRASVAAPFVLLACIAFMTTAAIAVPDPDSGGGATMAQTPAAAAPAQGAKLLAPKPVEVTLKADINLSTQQMTVSAGGKVLYVWPVSSGRRGYETPRGTFRPQWAARMHYSKKYDDAPMPHSVFFNGGIATHGTQSTGLLGRPASHGCVRLAPSSAATFYALVHKHGFKATRIVVRGTPKFRDEEIASRRRPDRDDSRPRVAARQYPPRGYAYAQPVYGYAPTYGYAAPRRYYVVQRPGYGAVRYLPPGYVRY